PGLGTLLTRRRDRIPTPCLGTVAGAVGGHVPASLVLGAGHSDVHQAAVVEGRHRLAEALLGVADLGLPELGAAPLVQRDQLAVNLADVDLAVAHRGAAVYEAAADRRLVRVDVGVVLPEHGAVLGVERPHVVSAGRHVHGPFRDHGRRPGGAPISGGVR